MGWFSSNWFASNHFASNHFGGQRAVQNSGGWFDYPDRRRSRDEERDTVDEVSTDELSVVAQVAKQSIRKVTRAEIDMARKWADALSKGQSVPFSLPSIQGFEGAFAFPADARLTEDEAIALVLLLSET